MATEIIPASAASLAILEPLAEQAQDFMREAKAPSTRRAYQGDWADFTAWCAAAGLASLPAAPETVGLYLTDRAATFKVSTIQRRLAAISQAHQLARLDTPTRSSIVRLVMAGIRRTKGTAQTAKAPAVTDTLKAMLATLPTSLLGTRDRALLLVGFAGAFRRSELISLDREDVRVTREGLILFLARSKTDQEGAGRSIGVPYGQELETCPVRSLQKWWKAGAITSGPIFRPINRHGQIGASRLSDKAVALIVKRCAEAAGLDPALYAGHSLRAGFATSAAAAGVEERAIMKQTGHKSVTVARRYIREGSLFRDNAAGKVGL